ncbi:hypothetical protein LOK49_LG11G02568 [Camellia lanceoleosa]|uniref:Uncharacterized protein n=1 Tax=Camellia lanceoleosa TaxID=1840588 RepID=A0ACC0G597_9ERIC|nr:hypothetical protein LOK49_LG11G02568 [Camellia lanceoleosa]
MLKKCFLLNSKVVPKRLSKEEKGKGTVMSGACAQYKLQGSLYPDLFSVLDPLDMALIQDSLGNDFQFDWDAALEHIQPTVGLDDTNFPLSKGREQPGSSNTGVYTGVAVEPGGHSPSKDNRPGNGARWDCGNVIREGPHSGLGCSKNSEVDMSGTSLNKDDKPTQKVKRPRRVHLGKDFLLIDRNSCQALQSGRSKRIRAFIPCCPKSSKLIFDIAAGKRKREPWIEDFYSDPSLFRPPRRRAFGLG